METSEGKEQEGKEEKIRTLLENTSSKVSLRMKGNLSSKLFRHILKCYLYFVVPLPYH